MLLDCASIHKIVVTVDRNVLDGMEIPARCLLCICSVAHVLTPLCPPRGQYTALSYGSSTKQSVLSHILSRVSYPYVFLVH